MGKFEVTTVSISDGPDIVFRFDGDTCRAELDGAKLYAEIRGDGGINMRITDGNGFRLADLVLNERPERDLTENLTDIGSALLWSHWRFLRSSAQSASMSGDAENHTATSSEAP